MDFARNFQNFDRYSYLSDYSKYLGKLGSKIYFTQVFNLGNRIDQKPKSLNCTKQKVMARSFEPAITFFLGL